jgi:hypothetical protein
LTVTHLVIAERDPLLLTASVVMDSREMVFASSRRPRQRRDLRPLLKRSPRNSQSEKIDRGSPDGIRTRDLLLERNEVEKKG